MLRMNEALSSCGYAHFSELQNKQCRRLKTLLCRFLNFVTAFHFFHVAVTTSLSRVRVQCCFLKAVLLVKIYPD